MYTLQNSVANTDKAMLSAEENYVMNRANTADSGHLTIGNLEFWILNFECVKFPAPLAQQFEPGGRQLLRQGRQALLLTNKQETESR